MLILNLDKNKILKGETIIAEFLINDKQNKISFKNKYFVLNIKENGSNETQKISPQYFFGEPLIWEINPLIYKFTGTFIIFITILNDQTNKSLVSNNFIVEEDCIKNNINTCNNINKNYIKNKNLSKDEIFQTYIPSIQKPNQIINNTTENNVKFITNNLTNKVDINTNIYSRNKIEPPNISKNIILKECQNNINNDNTTIDINKILNNKIEKKHKNI